MERKKIHYGWIITFSCACVLFYSLGLAYNCMSLFLEPLMIKFGLTKTMGSIIVNVQIMGGLVALLVVGRLIGAFGSRKIMFVAGVIITIGFLLFSIAMKPMVCYVASFTVGIGYGLGSMVPVSTIITIWFDKNRALALGLATTGSAIATIVSPRYIVKIIETMSLEQAFVILGVIVISLSIFSFLLIRDFPQEKGLYAYGYAKTEKEKEEEDEENLLDGVSSQEAFKSVEFALLVGAVMLMGFFIMPLISHISPILLQSGYSSKDAAFFMSLFGLSMLVAKPLLGFLIDWWGIKKSSVAILLILLISLISGLKLDMNIGFPIVFALFLGAGTPINTVALPIWVGAIFGKKDMAHIFSILKLLFTGGAIFGSVLPGLMADLAGSYLYIFYVYLAILIIISILLKRLFSLE